MSLTFRDLLACQPEDRSQRCHHLAVDDFVRSIGGSTFTDRFDPPRGMRNADYLIPTDDGLLVVELKQLTGEASGGSLGDHLRSYVASGKARPAQAPPGTTSFDHESLHQHDWNEFNRSFRKSVPSAIKSGYGQLKETSAFLTKRGEPVSGTAIWLHNAADLHMHPDLLARQALVYVKKEWRSGSFRSLDFVICTCWDLWDNPWIRINTVASVKNPQVSRGPFQWHTIFPGKQSNTRAELPNRLRSAWIDYVVRAYGGRLLENGAGAMPEDALTRFALPDRVPAIGWATLAKTALVPVPAIPLHPDQDPRPA